MTNRELMEGPAARPASLDCQRRRDLRRATAAQPCPACRRALSALEATGVDVEDDYLGRSRDEYRCPCGAELEQVVLLVASGGPGWLWALNFAWLRRQLDRAEAYQREHAAKEGP